MIGKLKGLIDSYGDDFVIIDVGGVGYVAFCSTRTLQALPKPGGAASLAIETYVREDQIKLFGFASDNVQGVGTKVALALLSTFRPAELATALALKDVAAITRTPGVGKKLAERIVLDLKDKAPAFGTVDPALMNLQAQVDNSTAPTPAIDAISALVNLGYPQVQASAAVAQALKSAEKVSGGEAPKTEALIRLALKEMARG
jgi:holliday junction DNA helicase RuvA